MKNGKVISYCIFLKWKISQMSILVHQHNNLWLTAASVIWILTEYMHSSTDKHRKASQSTFMYNFQCLPLNEWLSGSHLKHWSNWPKCPATKLPAWNVLISCLTINSVNWKTRWSHRYLYQKFTMDPAKATRWCYLHHVPWASQLCGKIYSMLICSESLVDLWLHILTQTKEDLAYLPPCKDD